MTFNNFDDVNGTIIGEEYGQCWVTYDGWQQGDIMYARDYPEADAMCCSVIERLKAELGDNFKVIYPLEKWKFHFDGI